MIKHGIRHTLVLVLLLLLHGGAPALGQQAERTAMSSLVEAFSNGNVEALMARTADRVEIAINGERHLYSRTQAMYVLRDFFTAYPPRHLVLRDHSRSKGGWFGEGDYQYVGGERTAKVFIRMRQREGQWELREIVVQER